MLHVARFLNRVVGPFFTGACMAAVLATDEPAMAGILLAGAAAFAFISLPVTERLITRALSELDELTAWSSE